jgi:hypothetical protein
VADECAIREPKSSEKPFEISQQEAWEAYERVKANKSAPGADGCSIEEFEADRKNNLYRLVKLSFVGYPRANWCRNLFTRRGVGSVQSSQRVLRSDNGSATEPPSDGIPPPTRRPAFSIGLPSTTTRSAPVSPRRWNIRTFHHSLQLGSLVNRQLHRSI